MKIKWGALVTDGSGKLGGHVASKNRGGSYLRTNKVPSNPQTSFQQSGRAVFTELTQGWSGLTTEQRSTWNNATSLFQRTDQFGDVKTLSGKGLYISLNKELVLMGDSKLSEAPEPASIEVPTGLDVSIDTGTDLLEVDPGNINQTDRLVLKSTGVISAGTSFIKNKLRVIETGPDVTDPANSYTSYVSRFGTPVTGQWIGFSVYTINASGQRSPEVSGIFQV